MGGRRPRALGERGGLTFRGAEADPERGPAGEQAREQGGNDGPEQGIRTQGRMGEGCRGRAVPRADRGDPASRPKTSSGTQGDARQGIAFVRGVRMIVLRQ